MSCFLSILNPKPTLLHKSYIPLSSTPRLFSSHDFHFKSLSCRSSSDQEESRWLREEQRWLREEQRWLREEQRWALERDSLIREISELKLQIGALERQISSQSASTASSLLLPDAIANVITLLQVLKEKSNLIPESGLSVKLVAKVTEEKREEEEEQVEKGVVIEEREKVKLLERNEEKKRSALRIGSEGADVRDMQVC